jgi:hypothetical protein
MDTWHVKHAGRARRDDEFDVDLQSLAGALVLAALPAQHSPLVAPGGWQPVHPVAFQDPPHPEVEIVTSW